MGSVVGQPALELAERVAETAKGLGIETAVIGALALAAHGYVRGTVDVDLASSVDPGSVLRALQDKLREGGLKTRLLLPDAEDPLGGMLRVWTEEDDEGDPVKPLEVVNFANPYRPAASLGAEAIRTATNLDPASSLRYVQLDMLVALKLYAGGLRDLADVVELLACNPHADLDAVRAACARFGLEAQFERVLASR